jgi:hypothetical protein
MINSITGGIDSKMKMIIGGEKGFAQLSARINRQKI